MPRLACAFLPLFPLAARLRAEPELRSEPVAIVEGHGPTARLVALSRNARKYRLQPGMTLAQARSILPGLLARPRDPACERSALEAFGEALGRLTPRYELVPSGMAYLDLSGCLDRFEGEQPERGFALALEKEVNRTGLTAQVGIASSKLAARIAAQEARPGGPWIVPAGKEAEFLAPLPLARLDPVFEVAQTLLGWGIRTVGQLAQLPLDEVTSRLGEVGRQLAWQARGWDPHPLIPFEPSPVLAEGISLEWPLTSLEPFLFVARPALDRLLARLEAEALGCSRLELELELEPAGRDRRSLDLPAPTRDRKTLLELVRWNLEARPPGAAISGFTFFAIPDRPRSAQLHLFAPPELAPDQLATTLARLFAWLGADRVGSPRPTGEHSPGSFNLVPFSPPPARGPRPAPHPPARAGLLPVRCLRPPIPLEVELDQDSRPCSLTPTSPALPETAGKTPKTGPPPPCLQGRIRVASGPWWLEERWWEDKGVVREYWDVELDNGVLLRLYRDLTSTQWFADGLYD